MYLHSVRLSKRLDEKVAAILVVGHKVVEPRYECPAKSTYLLVHLRVMGCFLEVFCSQQGTHRCKELRKQLGSMIG